MNTVTVKGKTYITGQVIPAGQYSEVTVHVGYVAYWVARCGKPFGAVKMAREDAKPGTVGRLVWDAANAA